jgi:hypothetical protein
MDIFFEDSSSEKTICPHCKGSIEISVGLRSVVTIDVEPASYKQDNHCEEITKDDFSPYVRRLPNIGAMGRFFPAKSDAKEFLTNGHIAFLRSSLVDLEINLDETGTPANIQNVLGKFSLDLPTVVPVTQTRAYVRMMGEGVEMTALCRCINLAYSLFPDAVFYQYGTQGLSEEMPALFVITSDGELVGVIMGMKIYDEHFWDKG